MTSEINPGDAKIRQYILLHCSTKLEGQVQMKQRWQLRYIHHFQTTDSEFLAAVAQRTQHGAFRQNLDHCQQHRSMAPGTRQRYLQSILNS